MFAMLMQQINLTFTEAMDFAHKKQKKLYGLTQSPRYNAHLCAAPASTVGHSRYGCQGGFVDMLLYQDADALCAL